MRERKRFSVSSSDSEVTANVVVTHSLRAWVVARMRAGHFDHQLAVGVTGSAGSALSIHAARLRSDRARHSVAQALRRATVEVQLGPSRRSSSIPVNRENISAAEDVIETLIARLLSPHPVTAKGVARLRRILSDGRGPMYSHGRGDLADHLRAALAAL
jgi:hypothetical protein